MTYITVCDARKPVPIDIKEGNSISMTSMSLIYDFYNINTPQDVIKYKISIDDDEKALPFMNHINGIDILKYYDEEFNSDSGFDPIYYSYKHMSEKKTWDNYYFKTKQFKLLGGLDNGSSVVIDKYEDFKQLLDAFVGRFSILSYYKIKFNVKYVNVILNDKDGDLDSSFKCPSFDSGIDDYIHEVVIRDFPNMFSKNDSYAPEKVINKGYVMKKEKLDDVLNYDVSTSNRKYYHYYIKNSLKCFNPSIFFDNEDNMQGVFIFLRVNDYIHRIINFIRINYPDYYDSISDRGVLYYDRYSIKGNDTLVKIIDNHYGGYKWRCFTPYFIPKLHQLIYTSIESATILPGFYTLSSLLKFHLNTILEFDLNKFMVNFISKDDENGVVTVVKPSGSDEVESHGELYDVLWSKDSGRRFPDIIGPMKHINVHCEQINALSSVFIDHDGNQKHNKMIGTIKIKPEGNEFFGTRNDYDNERKIYFKLASPVKHITHLNFYFTDCDGKRITLNGPVLLNLVIQ